MGELFVDNYEERYEQQETTHGQSSAPEAGKTSLKKKLPLLVFPAIDSSCVQGMVKFRGGVAQINIHSLPRDCVDQEQNSTGRIEAEKLTTNGTVEKMDSFANR